MDKLDDINNPIQHRLYRKWWGMKNRCNRKEHAKYYKDKGISVCTEWIKDFEAFYLWAISNGYELGLSLERKDNSKGYSPENCSWIPLNLQTRNKSDSHFVEINGITKTIVEWCELYNIKWTTFFARTKRGWTGDKLLEKVR